MDSRPKAKALMLFETILKDRWTFDSGLSVERMNECNGLDIKSRLSAGCGFERERGGNRAEVMAI